jgi:predicted NAD/FAD-dependent oxidoreductase
MRAAIIGSGIAGLTCGRKLVERGWDITIFDKGRGPGGRMSTRRADGLTFDHGAQFFTVLDPRFREHTQMLRDAGVVAPWDGRFVMLKRGELQEPPRKVERLVGVPRMSAMTRHMAEGLNVVQGAEVTDLVHTGKGWTLSFEVGDEQEFSLVVVAVPAPQAADLLTGIMSLDQRIESVVTSPCLTAMVAFGSPLSLEFDAAFVIDPRLAWIARNGSKPGRGDGECWILQASEIFSGQHLEDNPEDIGRMLLSEFDAATAQTHPEPTFLSTHRWRYAKTKTPLGEDCLFDADLKVGACGDWCLGERVEDAYLSGLAMATRILAQ